MDVANHLEMASVVKTWPQDVTDALVLSISILLIGQDSFLLILSAMMIFFTWMGRLGKLATCGLDTCGMVACGMVACGIAACGIAACGSYACG
jgi:hypothetical protein